MSTKIICWQKVGHELQRIEEAVEQGSGLQEFLYDERLSFSDTYSGEGLDFMNLTVDVMMKLAFCIKNHPEDFSKLKQILE